MNNIMIDSKYGKETFSKESVLHNLKRLLNQVYKVLPLREEGGDWEKTLEINIIEISGLLEILPQYHDQLFSILCNLEGGRFLKEEDDFLSFRRIIFNSLNTLGKVIEDVGIR